MFASKNYVLRDEGSQKGRISQFKHNVMRHVKRKGFNNIRDNKPQSAQNRKFFF